MSDDEDVLTAAVAAWNARRLYGEGSIAYEHALVEMERRQRLERYCTRCGRIVHPGRPCLPSTRR